jgi:RNA polymerase sigma factor (TIGR02999 family)
MPDSELLANTTRLLLRLQAGDPDARDQLFTVVYDRLRRIAGLVMEPRADADVLQPTALVHEVWLRLAQNPDLDIDSRQHFVNIATRAMRNVLVDHARRRGAAKRGGEAERVPLDEALAAWERDGTVEPLVLEEALVRLEQRDRRLARVVELRFFAGLTLEETAQALGESRRQVQHAWTLARAWLARDIG